MPPASPERSVRRALLSVSDKTGLVDFARGLAELGIGKGSRIAIVLPNGPEMATAFLSVAAGATTAPLNPAYRAEELDFYLSDIGADALLVGAVESGPTVEVAGRLGIPVLRLSFDEASPAGSFRIDGEPAGPAVAAAGLDSATPGVVGEVVDPETGARIPLIPVPENTVSTPIVQPVPAATPVPQN